MPQFLGIINSFHLKGFDWLCNCVSYFECTIHFFKNYFILKEYQCFIKITVFSLKNILNALAEFEPRPPGYSPIVIIIILKLNDALAICIKKLIVNILDYCHLK